MKRSRKRLLTSVLALIGALIIAMTATVGWRPLLGPKARALTDRRFEPTPERLKRGEYLVRNVAACLFCHSEVDTATEGLPVKAGRAGVGRPFTAEDMPWLVAPNITSDPETGAGAWTDDTIARAIREGIGHDGRALFPMMPYQNYRAMSDEDLASVITYIRSLPAVRQAQPTTDIPFPPGPLINNLPEPLDGPVPAPDTSTIEKRGEYLTRLASCTECHTPRNEQGEFLPGMYMAGGSLFKYEGARPEAAAANLTPSPNGIPYYNEELFIGTIRRGRVLERQISDVMPWGHYRGMTDEDLKAIFAYLKTLTPVDHYVDNALEPTACATCGITHGGGARN